MALNPLQNQQLASNPQNSVWVMASAGSGKTKVLTDRVLRILLNGAEPNKILCLTYTKVASIEMQKRIYNELQQWVTCSTEELKEKLINLGENNIDNKKISRARSLLSINLDAEFKIRIQTIHSFCQSILKSFPFEAKIPINFELLEENHAKILLKDCQRKILQNSFEDKILQELVIKINSNIGDETIYDLISQLLAKKDKINFLKNKYLSVDNIIFEFYQKFNFRNIHIEENLSIIYNQFIENLDLNKLKNFSKKLHETNKTNIKSALIIDEFLKLPIIDNIQILNQAFFTKNDPRKLKLPDSLSEDFNNFIKHIDFFNQQHQLLKTIDNSASLLIIVDKILEEFQKNKTKNGFVDYSDLISITNQMLDNKDFCDFIKYKMDNSFDHLLVDEAQDTNPIQWSIIKALIDDFFSGNSKTNNSRSVFIVGDEKQSIMGFQGSDMMATKNFHDYLKLKSNYQLQDINLSVSFRSGKKILELVDGVFNNMIFQNAICKIGTYKQHISYRNTSAYVELWQGNKIKELLDDSITDKNNSIQNQGWSLDFTKQSTNNLKNILAKFVAYKIKNWHDEKRIIANKNRVINFDDIMILVRNRENDFIERLSYYFTQLNIPYTSVGRIKFSETLLIQDFLSIAKFTLLQSDSFNLACLLKSPFFNVEEPELTRLCNYKNSHDINLWESLQTTKYFLPLKNLIELSQNNNCFEFYFKILNDSKNKKNITARFGIGALEIINNFLLICQDFNLKNSPYLQKFLEFVEKIDPEINLNSNNKNQVKITTIHSSKGLQAPIVIIPDCLYQYHQQKDYRINLLWDDDFPLFINKESVINSQVKKLKDDKVFENYEEHLRQLYVALTRAEDELYIGGLEQKIDEKSWYGIINSLGTSFYQATEIEATEIEDVEVTSNLPRCNDIKLEFADYNFTQYQPNFDLVNQSLSSGKKIHQILEIIGKNNFMPQDWLINLSYNLIDNNLAWLDEKTKTETKQILKNFIQSTLFTEIFSQEPDSKILCEYEISYQQQNLRIDLIKIHSNNITIIDYKTDENHNGNIPDNYLKQINLYREAVQNIYPHHSIKCAILWLKQLKLDLINKL